MEALKKIKAILGFISMVTYFILKISDWEIIFRYPISFCEFFGRKICSREKSKTRL